MSGPADRFGDATPQLRNVERHRHGEYVHEYVGEQEATDAPVRIHTLAPELADDEAAVSAFTQVSDQWYNASANANIVPILDRDTDPRPWIAVPYASGTTLEGIRDDLSPEAIEAVITETADALRTLGLYNTAHGHLSPTDVSLPDGTDGAGTPTVQVGGFGLEQAVRAAVGEAAPTPYTAPERLDDPTRATERTDVYGLGAVTYFALTGRPPVDGDDLDAAIRDGPAAPPSEYEAGVSPALDDVVLQALSAEPTDRQDSPYAFGRAFRSAYDPAVFGSAGATPDSGAGQPSPGEVFESGDDHTEPDSEQTDPKTTDGEQTDPKTTDGEQTDPTATDSEQTDPTATDDGAAGGEASGGSRLTRRAVVGALGLIGVGGAAGGYLYTNSPSETGAGGGAGESTAGDQQAADQVTNRLEVVSAIGTAIDDGAVGRVRITVRQAPDADNIDLATTTLQFVHSTGSTDLTFGAYATNDASGDGSTFGVTDRQDDDGSIGTDGVVLNDPADRAQIVLDTGSIVPSTGGLEAGDTATVRLNTESGGTTELRLVVPETLSRTDAVVL